MPSLCLWRQTAWSPIFPVQSKTKDKWATETFILYLAAFFLPSSTQTAGSPWSFLNVKMSFKLCVKFLWNKNDFTCWTFYSDLWRKWPKTVFIILVTYFFFIGNFFYFSLYCLLLVCQRVLFSLCIKADFSGFLTWPWTPVRLSPNCNMCVICSRALSSTLETTEVAIWPSCSSDLLLRSCISYEESAVLHERSGRPPYIIGNCLDGSEIYPFHCSKWICVDFTPLGPWQSANLNKSCIWLRSLRHRVITAAICFNVTDSQPYSSAVAAQWQW